MSILQKLQFDITQRVDFQKLVSMPVGEAE